MLGFGFRPVLAPVLGFLHSTRLRRLTGGPASVLDLGPGWRPRLTRQPNGSVLISE